ncbi:Unknown protein, partial [Striga hermonthica]
PQRPDPLPCAPVHPLPCAYRQPPWPACLPRTLSRPSHPIPGPAHIRAHHGPMRAPRPIADLPRPFCRPAPLARPLAMGPIHPSRCNHQLSKSNRPPFYSYLPFEPPSCELAFSSNKAYTNTSPLLSPPCVSFELVCCKINLGLNLIDLLNHAIIEILSLESNKILNLPNNYCLACTPRKSRSSLNENPTLKTSALSYARRLTVSVPCVARVHESYSSAVSASCARSSYARAVTRASSLSRPACACAPPSRTPTPPRIGSLALVAYSRAVARLLLLLPASRASSPLPRVSRTSLVPAPLALPSRALRVALSAPAPRSPTVRSRAPVTLRVPPTTVACLSTAHPIASIASDTWPNTYSRASRPDARPTPDSLSSSTLLPSSSVGSPVGHGSHPSIPMQSPTLQIQPSSILLVPPLRATVLRTRLFLEQGLHQHFSSFVSALCILRARLVLLLLGLSLACGPHPFGQSLTHDGRLFGFDGSSNTFSNHKTRPSSPSSFDSPGTRPKIVMPTFTGTDPDAWLSRAVQFFEINDVPRYERVQIAAYHLDGEENVWWQWVLHKNHGEHMRWRDFDRKLITRFGSSDYHDYNEALSRIKQVGSMREYQKEFERIASRVRDWPESTLVGTFVGGLKAELAAEVRLDRPGSMRAAMESARLHEDHLMA